MLAGGLTLMAGGARADSSTTVDLVRFVRRHELAARTVRVTFVDALHSQPVAAVVRAADRAGLEERWRSWALAALDGYAREVRDATAGAGTNGDGTLAEALHEFHDQLIKAYRAIRR